MDGQYAAEQLNNLNREELVSLVLSMQEKTLSMDQKLQLILEQLAVQKHDRFGQSSEKLLTPGQLRFLESDDRSSSMRQKPLSMRKSRTVWLRAFSRSGRSSGRVGLDVP